MQYLCDPVAADLEVPECERRDGSRRGFGVERGTEREAKERVVEQREQGHDVAG
jgi:hypothetical protein